MIVYDKRNLNEERKSTSSFLNRFEFAISRKMISGSQGAELQCG